MQSHILTYFPGFEKREENRNSESFDFQQRGDFHFCFMGGQTGGIPGGSGDEDARLRAFLSAYNPF